MSPTASAKPTAAPDAQLHWHGQAGDIQGRLFNGAPGPGPCDTLLVFFHPGGFVLDESDAGDHCLRVVADACGVLVVAPAYALAPERPFPAAVEDAHTVLQAVMQQRTQLGWNGTHLLVAGVEAGGNLAAVSALVCRDRQGPALAGQILIMPMLDTSLHCASMRCAAENPNTRQVVRDVERSYRMYLPHPADRLHPYASPLHATRLSPLPPALILHTEGDPLSDEGRIYADKLRDAGNQVQQVNLPAPHEAKLDSQGRCQVTSDDPAITSMKQFIDTIRQTSRTSSRT